MLKILVGVLLILSFQMISCQGVVRTPPPSTAAILLPATPSPPSLPTATPTATAAPTPTATSTPVAESRWQCDPSGGSMCFGTIREVTMLNANEGWAFGTNGIVLHYTKAPGETKPSWQRVGSIAVRNLSTSAPGIGGVAMVSPNEGWGIDGGWIFHFQDGVATYPLTSLGSIFLDIEMLTPDEGWAVGIEGTIFHYLDGVWQLVPTPTTEALYAIDMLSAEEGWAVGNRIILHYQHGQWAETAAPSGYYRDIDMVNESEGWAVGDEYLLHYHNGVWEPVTTALGANDLGLRVVTMVNPDEGWAVGMGGRILHYQQGQWQEVDSPTQNDLVSIAMVNAEEGWAVGANSTILHYEDAVWKIVDEAMSLPHTLIDLSDTNGEIWAVGQGGTIWQRTGEQWQPVTSPTEANLEERVA